MAALPGPPRLISPRSSPGRTWSSASPPRRRASPRNLRRKHRQQNQYPLLWDVAAPGRPNLVVGGSHLRQRDDRTVGRRRRREQRGGGPGHLRRIGHPRPHRLQRLFRRHQCGHHPRWHRSRRPSGRGLRNGKPQSILLARQVAGAGSLTLVQAGPSGAHVPQVISLGGSSSTSAPMWLTVGDFAADNNSQLDVAVGVGSLLQVFVNNGPANAPLTAIPYATIYNAPADTLAFLAIALTPNAPHRSAGRQFHRPSHRLVQPRPQLLCQRRRRPPPPASTWASTSRAPAAGHHRHRLEQPGQLRGLGLQGSCLDRQRHHRLYRPQPRRQARPRRPGRHPIRLGRILIQQPALPSVFPYTVH